jgi:hypothetical protein
MWARLQRYRTPAVVLIAGGLGVSFLGWRRYQEQTEMKKKATHETSVCLPHAQFPCATDSRIAIVRAKEEARLTAQLAKAKSERVEAEVKEQNLNKMRDQSKAYWVWLRGEVEKQNASSRRYNDDAATVRSYYIFIPAEFSAYQSFACDLIKETLLAFGYQDVDFTYNGVIKFALPAPALSAPNKSELQ